MPITREKKETIIADLKKLFEKASILVFVNFHGLSVAKERKLRGQFRGAEIKYKVAKKTLLKKALESAGFTDTPALTAKFIKAEKEGLKIIGGIYEARYVGADIIKQLGAIPSREVLLTPVAFILSQPVRRLARVLKEVEKIKN